MARLDPLAHPQARSQTGQSLAELAIILPILLILMLGAIDFGRSYFAFVSVTNAARTGADYGARNASTAGDAGGIEDAALSETGELIGTSSTNPVITSTTGTDGAGGTYVEVTVNYTFETIFDVPWLPNSFDIERTVRAKVAE